jgi:hypothetical protein
MLDGGIIEVKRSQQVIQFFSNSAAVPWYQAGGAPVPFAAYQPIGAASLAASYLRIAGTGGNANLDPAVVGVGVAPTFAAATGWALNGSSQFLDTGFVPATNVYSFVVRYAAAAGGQILSCYTSGSRNVQITSTSFSYPNTSASVLASGVKGLTPVEGYHDGVARSLTFTGWTSTNARSLYIGARNNIGTADGFFGGTIAALAIYSGTLTTPQMLAISTAMANLA